MIKSIKTTNKMIQDIPNTERSTENIAQFAHNYSIRNHDRIEAKHNSHISKHEYFQLKEKIQIGTHSKTQLYTE